MHGASALRDTLKKAKDVVVMRVEYQPIVDVMLSTVMEINVTMNTHSQPGTPLVTTVHTPRSDITLGSALHAATLYWWTQYARIRRHIGVVDSHFYDALLLIQFKSLLILTCLTIANVMIMMMLHHKQISTIAWTDYWSHVCAHTMSLSVVLDAVHRIAATKVEAYELALAAARAIAAGKMSLSTSSSSSSALPAPSTRSKISGVISIINDVDTVIAILQSLAKDLKEGTTRAIKPYGSGIQLIADLHRLEVHPDDKMIALALQRRTSQHVVPMYIRYDERNRPILNRALIDDICRSVNGIVSIKSYGAAIQFESMRVSRYGIGAFNSLKISVEMITEKGAPDAIQLLYVYNAVKNAVLLRVNQCMMERSDDASILSSALELTIDFSKCELHLDALDTLCRCHGEVDVDDPCVGLNGTIGFLVQSTRSPNEQLRDTAVFVANYHTSASTKFEQALFTMLKGTYKHSPVAASQLALIYGSISLEQHFRDTFCCSVFSRNGVPMYNENGHQFVITHDDMMPTYDHNGIEQMSVKLPCRKRDAIVAYEDASTITATPGSYHSKAEYKIYRTLAGHHVWRDPTTHDGDALIVEYTKFDDTLDVAVGTHTRLTPAEPLPDDHHQLFSGTLAILRAANDYLRDSLLEGNVHHVTIRRARNSRIDNAQLPAVLNAESWMIPAVLTSMESISTLVPGHTANHLMDRVHVQSAFSTLPGDCGSLYVWTGVVGDEPERSYPLAIHSLGRIAPTVMRMPPLYNETALIDAMRAHTQELIGVSVERIMTWLLEDVMKNENRYKQPYVNVDAIVFKIYVKD